MNNFAKNNAEDRMKLHNMGVLDSLLSICNNDNLSNDVKVPATSLLATIVKDDKVLEELKTEPKLTQATALILNKLSEKPLKDEEELLLMKNVMEVAGSLANVQETLDAFIEEGGTKAIIDVMNLNKENPEALVSGSITLSKIAVDEDIVNEISELGGDKLMNSAIISFPNLLELLRALALQTGKTATTAESKNKIGESTTPKQLILGLKQFNNDCILGTNCGFAFTNLCYDHPKNSEMIIKSDMMEISKNLINKFINEPELVANICSFYNSLIFKNSKNKKEIGKMGIMNLLKTVFDKYSKDKELQENTIKQCLKFENIFY